METEFKTCACCGETLPITEFHLHSNFSDGHLNICKKCRSVKQKESRMRAKQNRIIQLEQMKKENEEKGTVLKHYTPRELLTELKSRGYVWKEMYCKVSVDYDNI